jgi:hypothetical protein
MRKKQEVESKIIREIKGHLSKGHFLTNKDIYETDGALHHASDTRKLELSSQFENSEFFIIDNKEREANPFNQNH